MAEQITLTLNPAGVAEPLKRAVVIATETIGTCLRGLSKDDLSPPELRAGFVGYRFEGLHLEGAERRTLFHNWLFSKGFQDLTRALREMLEEAVLYLTLIKREAGLTTIAQIKAEIAAARAAAQRPPFPQLLEQVNADLVEPITFEAEYLSLQKVRNCLEHRGGLVAAKDVSSDTGILALSFPRLKLFYMRDGEEVELAADEAIDTHQPGNLLEEAAGVPIMLKRVTRVREYALGDPVVITLDDFAEIAMACQLFADDLASKLPTLPSVDQGATEGIL